MTVSDLIGEIDAQPRQGNLSSALRVFVLEFYRSLATPILLRFPPHRRSLLTLSVSRLSRERESGGTAR